MTEPMSEHEQQYVVLLFLHLKATYESAKDGMVIYMPGLCRDVFEFLVLPVPFAVWQSIQQSFEPEFIEFVEQCRREVEGSAGVTNKAAKEVAK